MKVILAALLLVPPTLVATPAAVGLSAPASAAAPAHSLTVSGPGVASYPAFDPGIDRYGITTTNASTGTVQVSATTSDPAGSVLINGRPAPNGKRQITGLEPNDEVSVIIKDSGGTAAYSAIYLPAGFPSFERTTPDSTQLTEGLVLLTISAFTQDAKAYDTAVDRNGVPIWTHTSDRSSLDFKRQPNGTLTVSRAEAADNVFAGSPVVELDEQLRPSGTEHRTVGLVNTDGHDSMLLDDGSSLLIAYERNPDTGLTDAVIQEIAPDGELVFEWDSADFADETVAPETEEGEPAPDYAHINSVQVMADGDLLASFRHFSSVFKIARTDHDGFAAGDVVWKLGGRDSDFTFPDDPANGPCAQHTASETPEGNILIYDNGSGGFGPAFCVDQSDPSGPATTRTQTYLTAYDVTSTPGEAAVAWQWTEPDRFAIFAGGTERLENGNTLVGWAAARKSVASEISPEGELLWDLRDSAPHDERKFTYRAHVTTIPDAIPPQVALPVREGASFASGQVVRPAYSCTDRGGSGLDSCATTGLIGDRLDTSAPGRKTVSVTATDGAGNTTTQTRTYVVEPTRRPDALIRKPAMPRFKGDNVYGPAPRQLVVHPIPRAGQSRFAIVRVTNDGNAPERFRVKAAQGGPRFRVAYLSGGKHVTGQAIKGTLRTPVLKPGGQWTMRIKVTRTVKARQGNVATFPVRATSANRPVWDAVGLRVRAR